MATSAAAAPSEGAGYSMRDREPPPGYDGENPESTFVIWERNVRLWEFETDIQKNKRGVKLYRALSGTARIAVEEMPFDELACEDGLRNLMQRLREFFNPHLEVSLPRAFETAVYGQPRQGREGFGEYIARMDRAFNRLKQEGVDLPESAQGYVIYRQAALNENQDQRFLVWSNGAYDRSSVVKALRKLDKVVKEKGKTGYLTDVPEYGNEIFAAEGNVEDYEDESDGEYIYLQEGDLSEVMEEQDVMTALANYKEIRQALKDQRNGRGYYGKGTGFAKGKGKGKWNKVHMEQVKLRTKCWKCHQIGHWGRECNADPATVKAPSSVASGGGSSVSTSKSGFLVVSEQAEKSSSTFWLRQYIEQAKTKQSASPAEYKVEPSFCGITTCPEHGVVDTAAEGGLIGKYALDRLERKLYGHGVRIKWIPKESNARGVGGNATCVGVALIPIGLGGIHGILETTVVDGDVPLLLPVRMLKGLKAVVNMETMRLSLNAYGVEVDMHELPSGHVTVDIMQFKDGRFSMPMEVPGCVEEDFQVVPSTWLMHGSSAGKCDSAEMAQGDVRSIRSPRFNVLQQQAMQNLLLSRIRRLGAASSLETQDQDAMDVSPPTHNARKAIRGWRVILDKVIHLMLLTELQEVAQEWFPQSLPSPGSRSEPKETSLADTYAAIIVGARMLTPLRSKEPAKVSISNCVRPNTSLKGGGNASLSYITCRECNARWESHMTAADIKKYLKDTQEVERQGLLSQGRMEDPEEEWSAGIPLSPQREMAHALESQKSEIHELKSVFGNKASSSSRPVPVMTSGPLMRTTPKTKAKAASVVTDLVADALANNMNFDPAVVDLLSETEDLWISWRSEEVNQGGNWYEPGSNRQKGWVRALQRRSRQGDSGALCAGWYYEELSGTDWLRRDGPLPLQGDCRVRCWLTLSKRSALENFFEDDKVTSFTSKSRKLVNGGIGKILAANATVAEVFSPPRIAEMAGKKGMVQGTSFDLETGWDLSDPAHKKRMWSRLQTEQPDLIVICPPCKMFSVLQEMNYANMPFDHAVRCLEVGIQDLETACLVARWQIKRKKYFLFEHPLWAYSWKEECLKKLEQQEGVEKVRCDMCAYGLAVDDKGYNYKPTGILVNSPHLAKRMSRRCPGNHTHSPLFGGKAKKAQVYTPEFCLEVVKGLLDQLREDYVQRGAEVFASEAVEPEDDPEEEELGMQVVEEEAGEQGGPEEITPSEKAAVMKLHRGVGHPALPDFIRFMKAARIRSEIVRWTSRKFRCETCEARPKTKAIRPATIPKTYQPNKVVGIDLIYIPAVGGQHLLPALSILDWGSNYQMVELLPNKEPSTVWNTMWSCWARTFGLPEVVVCDAGKEFAAEFVKTATANGVVTFQIGARAP